MKKHWKGLLTFVISIMVFMPCVGVNAQTISEVTIQIERPIVGDKVLPVGYTGPDVDEIADDFTSEPDHYPNVISLTDGVSIENTYWLKDTTDLDTLFFGKFKKSTDYLAEIGIIADQGIELDDNLIIKYQYKVGDTTITMDPVSQGTIHVQSGYNLYYTDFIARVPSLNQFKVKFDTKGGSTIADQTLTGTGATQSAAVTKPTDPKKNGHKFAGWYTDSNCTDGNEFDFSVNIDQAITLYAKWIPITVSSTSNPATSDNILIYVFTLILSAAGLTVGIRKTNKI